MTIFSGIGVPATIAGVFLSTLVTLALALLLSKMDGPVDMFVKMRTALGAYDIGKDGRPDSGLGRLISCPYCIGVWVALIPTLVAFAPWLFAQGITAVSVVCFLFLHLSVLGFFFLLLAISGIAYPRG